MGAILGARDPAVAVKNAVRCGKMTALDATGRLTRQMTDALGTQLTGLSPVSWWSCLPQIPAQTVVDSVGGINGTLGTSVAAEGVDPFLMSTGHLTTPGAKYSVVPFNAALNTAQFTVAMTTVMLGGAGTLRYVLASRETAKGYFIGAQSTDKWMAYGGNGTSTTACTGPNVAIGEWVRLIFSYDGVQAHFWVNGIDYPSAAFTYVPNTANPLRFGIGGTTTAASAGLNQYADAVYFDRALGEADVRILDRLLAVRHSSRIWDRKTFTATNAASALTTPTYDASGQAVHPDVLDFGVGGWNGHRYWMAMTPYPGAVDSYENPSILVSDNKTTWAVPSGLTNPVIPGFAGGWNSDPDLVLSGSTLYMVYRHMAFNGSEKLISETHSTDGVTWSVPTTIIDLGAADSDTLASPAIVWNGSRFVMFYVDCSVSPRRVYVRTSAAVAGPWSGPVLTSMETPRPADPPFHIDVIWQDGRYVALVYCSGNGELGLAVSGDAVSWSFYQSSVLAKSGSGGWDSGSLYRSTFIPNGSGYDIWYSAYLNSVFHIGFTTATLAT